MKTRLIVEDIGAPGKRTYVAEVEVKFEDDDVLMRREGSTAGVAASKLIRAIRSMADDAEEKFRESGVLPSPPGAS